MPRRSGGQGLAAAGEGIDVAFQGFWQGLLLFRGGVQRLFTGVREGTTDGMAGVRPIGRGRRLACFSHRFRQGSVGDPVRLSFGLVGGAAQPEGPA